MFNSNKKDFRRLDSILILSVLALVIFGLFVLDSAIQSARGNIKSQIIATIIGFFIFFLIYFLEFDLFKKLKWFIYLIIAGLLLATILFGTGKEEWGANLWIRLGPVSIQPSEFVKVFLILFLAAFIDDNKANANSLKFVISYFVLALIPVALIVKQEDVGTAAVVLFITAAMFFASGINTKTLLTVLAIFLIVIILLGTIAFPLIWNKMAPYQKERILNFIDPSRDSLGTGLQMERGYIAIGSGGLTGRGYKQGPMAQNDYIPLQHTDYIFPVLIEEFGFIGGAVVLGLYLIMIIRMLFIALRSPSLFGASLSVGVAAMFFIHIFENVGMTMRIMPVTGIPLPFFSNGGTFQIVNLACVSLVLTIGALKKPLDF